MVQLNKPSPYHNKNNKLNGYTVRFGTEHTTTQY